ncbi:UDP-galactose 4-epimerase [Roseobacter denitrificans OCh 114]|nr:UDP-galactose 4-epimerase [Roseobacter denitrificans OCh 114]
MVVRNAAQTIKGTSALNILLTGGAGYIGSHTFLSLIDAGHKPIVVDTFDNSSPQVLDRLHTLTGEKPVFHQADVRDSDRIADILTREKCDAVVHFAGRKAVGEGQSKPLLYFDQNVGGTVQLLHAMNRTGCKKLIFSSSAVVYGNPEYLPIDEEHPLSTCNVYGDTKRTVEDMLRALSASDQEWSVVLLRYFNPVGAHKSGEIGEFPRGIPNNLMPYVTQVAVGQLEKLSVFGNDFDTRDGTGVRDYIHVCDLADGHVSALKLLDEAGCTAMNLGTGKGYSVLDIITTFETVNDVRIPYQITARRPGDVAACYANPSRARSLTGWQAKLGLAEMCRDAWHWQRKNPKGFAET